MSLPEVRKQVLELSVSDRLALIQTIVSSLERELKPLPDVKGAVEQMRGLAKTNQPVPTDAQVETMCWKKVWWKNI